MKLHLPLIAAAVVWFGHASPARCAEASAPAPPADAATSTAAEAEDKGWFDGWKPRFITERFGKSRQEATPPESSVILVAGQEQLPPLPELGPLQERQLNDPYLGGGLEANGAYVAPLPAYADIPVPSDGRGYYSGTTSIVSGEPYEWHLLPQGLIYRSYLAGEKESRLRSFWYNERGRNLWDLTLGGNVGLIRYGTKGNVRPEGWQLGLEGAGIVRLDVDQNRDVDSDDFRGGIPITWGDSIYQVKFAYYHLSSHLGDEYLIKHPGYPRLNYSRDCFVWGHSLYPTENFPRLRRARLGLRVRRRQAVGIPVRHRLGAGERHRSARRAVRGGERSHPRRTQLRRQRRVPGRLGVAAEPGVGVVPRRYGILQRQGRSVLVLPGQHREDRRRHLV